MVRSSFQREKNNRSDGCWITLSQGKGWSGNWEGGCDEGLIEPQCGLCSPSTFAHDSRLRAEIIGIGVRQSRVRPFRILQNAYNSRYPEDLNLLKAPHNQIRLVVMVFWAKSMGNNCLKEPEWFYVSTKQLGNWSYRTANFLLIFIMRVTNSIRRSAVKSFLHSNPKLTGLPLCTPVASTAKNSYKKRGKATRIGSIAVVLRIFDLQFRTSIHLIFSLLLIFLSYDIGILISRRS